MVDFVKRLLSELVGFKETGCSEVGKESEFFYLN